MSWLQAAIRIRTPRADAAVGARPRRLMAGLVALAIAMIGLIASPLHAFAASSGTLSMAPGRSASQIVTSSDLGDVTASATFTVPAQRSTYLAVQMRSVSVGEGYRAKARIQSDGSVSVSFSRVESSRETSLGSLKVIGLTVSTGQRLDLEASVTGTDPVQLSVRAWVHGSTKPNWQLTYSDSSKKQHHRCRSSPALWSYLSWSAGSTATVAYANATAAATGTAPDPGWNHHACPSDADPGASHTHPHPADPQWRSAPRARNRSCSTGRAAPTWTSTVKATTTAPPKCGESTATTTPQRDGYLPPQLLVCRRHHRQQQGRRRGQGVPEHAPHRPRLVHERLFEGPADFIVPVPEGDVRANRPDQLHRMHLQRRLRRLDQRHRVQR